MVGETELDQYQYLDRCLQPSVLLRWSFNCLTLIQTAYYDSSIHMLIYTSVRDDPAGGFSRRTACINLNWSGYGLGVIIAGRHT